jgi:DNA-binding winged helix-turn-helix (wHTH) protein
VRLRLGDLTFDPDARQLLRGRKEIHLSPKAFELLKTLIDQRPRALSKNELHEHLWPTTFVSEANLASLIAELREALGENARQPRFIRTAHRFGYAFCGEPVEEPAAHSRGGRLSGEVNTRSASLTGEPGKATTFCWLIRDGKRLPLRSGENILGRESDDGSIRLDSPTVSRQHARISISADCASLEDLGSKNGTFLRGEPVTAVVPLIDGDEIRVGSVVLRFRSASGSRTTTWTHPN